MCRRITCEACGKPSYAGCGRHVDQVLGDVPVEARCAGHAASRGARSGDPGSTDGAGGWLGALFGRGDAGRGGAP